MTVSVIHRGRALALAAIACALASSFASALPAFAQQVPVRDLPAPTREIDDPFTLVGGGIELRPSQVLLVDVSEMQLTLVDFAKGTKTAVGRQGSGPGEYRTPAGLFRSQGDTIWLVDATQQRLIAFGPDFAPGPTTPLSMLDQATMTTLSAPFFGDRRGRLYGTTMSLQIGRGGGGAQVGIPDSAGIVSMPLRDPKSRTDIAKVRVAVSGKPEMKQLGERSFKMSVAFPGLVASDPWTVFPDGRVAIVRGGNYTVEFIAADGKRAAPIRVAYEPVRVTEADRKAEMDTAQRQMKEQMKTVQKMMPPNVNMEMELVAPADWPANYPAVAAMGLLTAPDGRLWVKRAVPVRVGREQWDVLDTAGKLVARWRLPSRTTLVAIGQGVIYTVRTDEDDLRYVQQVTLPK